MIRSVLKRLVFRALGAALPWGLSAAIGRILDGAFTARVISRAAKAGRNVSLRRDAALSGLSHMEFGEGFHAYARLRMDAIEGYMGDKFNPRIRIGSGVIIQSDCHVGAVGVIDIGDETLIASKVFISDHSHGDPGGTDRNVAPAKRRLRYKGPIRIGPRCWIGENVAILGGVNIGEGCVIGANSVVTKDVPAWSVAVGAPARVVRVMQGVDA